MKRTFLFLTALCMMLSMAQAQFVDFGIEIWKGSFAAADIDNDGDMDVIVSGDTAIEDKEAGAILINNGTGVFTPKGGDRIITTGRGGNINFGDIDGDGDIDVIFAGWGCNNSVKAGIALNDGKGNFSLANTKMYPVLNAETIVSCGFVDLDLNGLLDYYFFGNGAGNCVVYFQQPDGSFQASANSIVTTKRFGDNVGSDINYNFIEPEVTIIDFNKDGYPDMWINAADLNAKNEGLETQRFSYLFKNDGFGKLKQFAGVEVPFKKANGTSSWADVNNDGFPDMLLNGDGWLNSGEDTDFMWRIFQNNNGTSVQKRWEQIIARQAGIGNGSLWVDWDSDGKLDFFTGGWNEALKKQEIALFTGNDPAAFTFTRSPLSDSYFQGASEQGLLVADLNGDDKVELLLNGFCATPISKRASGYMVNKSEKASSKPEAPRNLKATVSETSDVMVTLSWEAPESEKAKYGTTYNIALKNTDTGKWYYNPMASVGGENNGWRKVAGRMGNVFTNTKYEVYNLPKGNYEWTVQAINGAYLGGAFATTKTFSITKGTNATENNRLPEAKVYSVDKKLFVQDASNSYQILRVYTFSGAELKVEAFNGNTELTLPSGLYIVELTKGKNQTYRTKVRVK